MTKNKSRKKSTFSVYKVVGIVFLLAVVGFFVMEKFGGPSCQKIVDNSIFIGGIVAAIAIVVMIGRSAISIKFNTFVPVLFMVALVSMFILMVQNKGNMSEAMKSVAGITFIGAFCLGLLYMGLLALQEVNRSKRKRIGPNALVGYFFAVSLIFVAIVFLPMKMVGSDGLTMSARNGNRIVEFYEQELGVNVQRHQPRDVAGKTFGGCW